MAQHQMSLANFVCKFGDSENLWDYVEEIVLPAFFDDTLVRTYGQVTEYFVYEPKLVRIVEAEVPVIGVAGWFIKNTILERTQYFDDEDGLVEDHREIESAPSAFFVLILNDHKLLYLTETPYAPTISNFSSTIGSFLRIKHREFINNTYDEARGSDEKVSKKALRETHKKPQLVILPLNTKESISNFVESMRQLRRMELQLITPNQEMDNQAVYAALRKHKEKIQSSKTTVSHQNKEGLDKPTAVEQIHDASATGNQLVKLVGTDTFGNTVRGNNENFRLAAKVDDIPTNLVARARKMYQIFLQLLKEGTIKIDDPIGDVKEIMQRLSQLLG